MAGGLSGALGLNKTNDSSVDQTASNNVAHTTQQSNSVSAGATASAYSKINQKLNFSMVPLPICTEGAKDYYGWANDNICVTNDAASGIENYLKVVNQELMGLPAYCCLNGYATMGGLGESGASTPGGGGGDSSGSAPSPPGSFGPDSKYANYPKPAPVTRGGEATLDKTRCAPWSVGSENAILQATVASDLTPVVQECRGDRSKPPPGVPAEEVPPEWGYGQVNVVSYDVGGVQTHKWLPCLPKERYYYCGQEQAKAYEAIHATALNGPTDQMMKMVHAEFKQCKDELEMFETLQGKALDCQNSGACCMNGCDVKIHQQGNADAVALTQLKQKSVASFSAVSDDTLSNQFEAIIKQANEGGIYPSLVDPSANSSNTNQNSSNAVKTATSQSNDVSASAAASAIAIVNQEMYVSIPGSCLDSNIEIDQSGAAKSQATAQIDQTSDNIMDSENMTDLSNDLKAAVDQSNKGLGWPNLGGIIGIILIIILAIIFIPIISAATKNERQQMNMPVDRHGGEYRTAYIGMSVWFAVAGVIFLALVLCTVETIFQKKPQDKVKKVMETYYNKIRAEREGGKACTSTEPCDVYCPRTSRGSASTIKGGKCKEGELCCELPPFDPKLLLYSNEVQRTFLPADDYRCTKSASDKQLHGCTGELANLRPGAIVEYADNSNQGPGGSGSSKLVLAETLSTIKQQVAQQQAAIGALEAQVKQADKDAPDDSSCNPFTNSKDTFNFNPAACLAAGSSGGADGNAGAGGAADMTFLANLGFWGGSMDINKNSPKLLQLFAGLGGTKGPRFKWLCPTVIQQKALMFKGFDGSQDGPWDPSSFKSLPSLSGYGSMISLARENPPTTVNGSEGSGGILGQAASAIGNGAEELDQWLTGGAGKKLGDDIVGAISPGGSGPGATFYKHVLQYQGAVANVSFIAPKQIYLDMFKQVQIYKRYSAQGKGADGAYGTITDSYLVYELKDDAKWPIGYADKWKPRVGVCTDDACRPGFLTNNPLLKDKEKTDPATRMDIFGNNINIPLTAEDIKFSDTAPTRIQVAQAICYLTGSRIHIHIY